jgi:hypothetical protein
MTLSNLHLGVNWLLPATIGYISPAKPAEATKWNVNTIKGFPLPIYNISAVETAVCLYSGEEDEVVLKFLLWNLCYMCQTSYVWEQLQQIEVIFVMNWADYLWAVHATVQSRIFYFPVSWNCHEINNVQSCLKHSVRGRCELCIHHDRASLPILSTPPTSPSQVLLALENKNKTWVLYIDGYWGSFPEELMNIHVHQDKFFPHNVQVFVHISK